MARDHARIHARVWTDPEFTALPRDAQWLYFAILSQPTLSFAGVTTFTIKRLARLAADTDPQTIQASLDILQEHRLVLVDDDTDELWVRSFVKNDGVLKSPNLLKRMVADVGGVMSPRIRAAFGWEWHTRLARQVADGHLDAVGDTLQALPEPPAANPWETLSGTLPPSGGNPSSGGSPTRAAPAPTPSPTPSTSPTPEDGAADASPRSDRAVKLPDGWRPDPEPQLVAAIGGQQAAAREFDRFCDYWRAKGGQAGRKTDWQATWRNWLRRTADDRPHNGHPAAAANAAAQLDRRDPAVWGARP